MTYIGKQELSFNYEDIPVWIGNFSFVKNWNSWHLWYRYTDDKILSSTNNITCSIPVAYPSSLKLTENTTDNITYSIPVACPSYLKLTENTLQNNIINFLDLKLILKNHKTHADIYDKRNDFSFKVNFFY